MGNLCENRLRATGNKEQVEMLASAIKKIYQTENFEEDYIESDHRYQLDLYFDSSWKFPKDHFLQFTSSIPDVTGMFIRVASDEPATNYLEQSIFEEGKWNFDKQVDIVTEINKLRENGILQIRKFLSENGDVLGLMEEGNTPPTIFVNYEGIPEKNYYDEIILSHSGKLIISLWDNTVINEDDLTTNHVLEIFNIISDKNRTYIKPSK